ncbi:MAG: META domain-containing protein [Bacteroidia bacterium]
MKSFYLFPLLLILACNSQRQVPQEAEVINTLEIPTLPDFKASGNEPAWMLEIEDAKSMRFKSFGLESFELLLSVPQAVKNETTQETIYTSNSKAGNLEVRILRKPCMDAMSGKSFSYEVKVKAKPSNATQDYQYEGCGMYIGDYRLNDIWALKEFNGEKINLKDFSRAAPYIELNLQTQKMLGNGGCNQMGANFVISEKTINFKSIRATKMACPQLQFESKFTSALANKTLTYKLQGLLLLLNDEENRMVFQKVD